MNEEWWMMKDEWWRMNEEWWMIKNEWWRMMISSCWGVLIYDGQTDGRTNKWMDICDCRVAFATENGAVNLEINNKVFIMVRNTIHLQISFNLDITHQDCFKDLKSYNQYLQCIMKITVWIGIPSQITCYHLWVNCLHLIIWQM